MPDLVIFINISRNIFIFTPAADMDTFAFILFSIYCNIFLMSLLKCITVLVSESDVAPCR